LDSGFVIGMVDGAVAQKNRKMVILDKDAIDKWNQISKNTMESI
jgi:hypothetical protein